MELCLGTPVHMYRASIMQRQFMKALFAVLALALAVPALAGTREEARVGDAADVLDQLLRIPEKSIPPALLARAYAVAVIPDVVKVGFGIAARRGKGVLVIRQDDNSWSNPAFVTLTGGSVGWQAGAQSTDVILVFKTRKGVSDIENGKLTLEGAGVTMDRKANAAFYGDPGLTPEKIFVSSPNIAPDIANKFVQILTAQTRRLPTSPGMDVGYETQPATADNESSNVRTFGLPGTD
jgi:lipid-binding SYLF domain-containing protein